MMNSRSFPEMMKRLGIAFSPVVPFDAATEKIVLMNFTASNNELTEDIVGDTERFSKYVETTLTENNSKYGIGGYLEHRTVYSRSKVFDTKDEPRRLHLGIDIWGKADTPVSAPLGGMVHSFAFNHQYGDYGATIILQHQLEAFEFHTLYGHLSLKDIQNLKEGSYISRGQTFAHFGEPIENGHWPPHLHFQLILDMELKSGDYPGVCKFSEKEKYALNCPDPDIILDLMKHAKSNEERD
jgi:murein DD-endopeptidase MepM/ murein hydrolase activator NlpD